MNKYKGLIFKYHRVLNNYSMDNIIQKTNYSKSKISEFENLKRTLAEEDIKELYHAIGLDYYIDKKAEQKIREKFHLLYQNILMYLQPEISFEELRNLKKGIEYSGEFLLWMFLCLVCDLYGTHHDTECAEHVLYETKVKIVDKKLLVSILEKSTEIQNGVWNSVCFDLLGCYYVREGYFDRAITFFCNAISQADFYRDRNARSAISRYHLGVLELRKGNFVSSIRLFNEAKTVFSERLLTLRSLIASTEMALALQNIGLYDESEHILKDCIQSVVVNYTDDIIRQKEGLKALCYLMSCYILSERYHKVVSLRKLVEKFDKENPKLNILLAFAYYRQGLYDDSNRYLMIAWRNRKRTIKTEQLLIAALKLELQNKPFAEIEKKYLQALEESERINNYQTQVAILESLIFCAEKTDYNEKKLYYYKMLIEKLKQKH